jgi:hypothetical protein
MILTTMLTLTGCGNTPNGNVQSYIVGGGAIIESQFQGSSGIPVNIGYVNITMSYDKDQNFNQYTSGGSDKSKQNFYTGISSATWENDNLRTPALWTVTWTANGTHPECQVAFGNGVQYLIWPIAFAQNVILCEEATEQAQIVTGKGGGSTSGTMSPINLNYPPSTLTAHGSGFSTTYSLPTVLFFDSKGNQVAEMDATDPSMVTSTSVTVPADLSSFITGAYTFVVCNMNSAGMWYAVTLGTVKATCIGVCA